MRLKKIIVARRNLHTSQYKKFNLHNKVTSRENLHFEKYTSTIVRQNSVVYLCA